MPLTVITRPDRITATSFTVQVPGRQVWRPRTVGITVTRAAGGAPNRAYLLTITDGTTTVAQTGAADAGTEPGTCTVTWCDAPASAIAAGTVGIVVAPLPAIVLQAGYDLIGTILNPHAGDTITAVRVWVDFDYTEPVR